MIQKKYLIAPSILSANLATLGEEVTAVLAAGADIIHIDVMDNHYVPNLTFGPMICKALRDYGITAPIDVHLMVSPVDELITAFAKAGATYLSFHPEATQHVDRSLQLILDHGCLPGLALNPATPLSYLDYVMDKLTFVLLMSVNPGFGGQQFIPNILQKIRDTRDLLDQQDHKIWLEVDGGVKVDNIAELAKAGAEMLVMGSAIFGAGNYPQTMRKIWNELKD